MKFSTHTMKLLESMNVALSKNKRGMILDFKEILGKARWLFKTERYDFWLKQIGEIDIDEIPMTHYGLSEAKRSLKYEQINRKTLEYMVADICEDLFAYSREDDMCECQADFHYYFYMPTGTVYKESGLGSSTLHIKSPAIEDIRLAKISELNIAKEELL